MLRGVRASEGEERVMGHMNDFAAIMRELADIKQQLRMVQMQPRPEWVTVAEYAKMVGVTPRTVRNWIASGQLETYQHGSKTMVRSSQAVSQGRRQTRCNT